jgi:hypothetical protein
MAEDDAGAGGSDRLTLYIGLIKFIVGTVAISVVTLYFNEQYRSAQLALEEKKGAHAMALQEKQAEVEYLSKFIPSAMDKDIKVRVDFADYMKSVALSDTLRKIWTNYYDVLHKKVAESERRIAELEEDKKRAAQKLTGTTTDRTIENKAKEIVDLFQSIDRDQLIIKDQLDRKRFGTFQENYFDFSDLLNKAANAQRAGKYDVERDLLQSAAERAPKELRQYFLSRLAIAYRSLRDFPSARKAMEEVILLGPATPDDLIMLAIMQKNDGAVGSALDSLNRALRLSPPSETLGIELIIAGYLIHDGKREAGMQRYEAIKARLQPRDSYITNIAWFSAVADRKDDFYEALERSLKVAPQQTQLWIDQEVDIDKYRDEERFKTLVQRSRIP